MSDEKYTLLLIDGHSLAFRAFYALSPDNFQTKDGQHTNAIHGFISMLLSLLQNEKPTHIAVAFDASRYSFRTREYPEYKGTRGETPPEFIGQIPLLREVLEVMNITSITKEDYEADDIVASLSKLGKDAGAKVLIVSGDRDTLQLVNDDVTLLYPIKGVNLLDRLDPAGVKEKYGISPEQYPILAALVGETSDNLPGVPKVGPKTAVKWIQQWPTMEEILEHKEEISGVVGENLRANVDIVLRNMRLNKLLTDLNFGFTMDDLKIQGLNESGVKQLFDRLQFRSLLTRVLANSVANGGKKGVDSGEAPASQSLKSSDSDVNVNGLKPPISLNNLVDEELANWLKVIKDTPVGIAVESGSTLTIGVATENAAISVPLGANPRDWAPLKDFLESGHPKYILNAKQAYKKLQDAGVALAGIAADPLLVAWLVDPARPIKSFEDLCLQTIGLEIKTQDPSLLFSDEPSTDIGLLAWGALQSVNAQLFTLEPSSMEVLSKIEAPLISVLAQMEIYGIEVDASKLGEISAQLIARAGVVAEAAFAELGFETNLASPKQLQEVLFEKLGLPKTRATKTGYTTDAAALQELFEKTGHPFLKQLLEHRDATKLGQITETLIKAIDKTGRIHTSFNQAGTSTGRLSSNDPNLQNIPVKTDVGKHIRSAFQSSADYENLLTADYSQIEMRIMAHLSKDESLISAFNSGEDLHRYVGSKIFEVPPSEVTANMRTKVKAMSYGLVYGLSAFGLARQLNIEPGEAKQLMGDYFSRFGGVRDYLRGVVDQARVDGYTETIFGRRRYFSDLNSSNRVLKANAERAALNAPIQGSAADIIKLAMISISERLQKEEFASRMLLQVHDELIFEIAKGEESALSALVSEEMSSAAKLSVPLDVQIGIGKNWDEAAH